MVWSRVEVDRYLQISKIIIKRCWLAYLCISPATDQLLSLSFVHTKSSYWFAHFIYENVKRPLILSFNYDSHELIIRSLCHHPNTRNKNNPTPSKYQSLNILPSSIRLSSPPASRHPNCSINYSVRIYRNSTCQFARPSKKQRKSTIESTTSFSCRIRRSITNLSRWFLIAITSQISSIISR